MSRTNKNYKHERQYKTGNKKSKKSAQNKYGSMGLNVGSSSREIPRQTTLTIPRSVNCWMPDRLRTTLRWWISPAINLSVTSYGLLYYQPTAAFDIDPALGGASVAGFNALAAIYSTYRVSASSCKVELVNSGLQTPVRLTLVPLNFTPPSSPTGVQVISMTDQPYAVSKLSGLRGSPMTSVQQGMNTVKIFGSPQAKYDADYASLVNTIPANNWYWCVAWYAPAVIPSVEGTPILNVSIEIEIEFYDRVRAVA